MKNQMLRETLNKMLNINKEIKTKERFKKEIILKETDLDKIQEEFLNQLLKL